MTKFDLSFQELVSDGKLRSFRVPSNKSTSQARLQMANVFCIPWINARAVRVES